MSYSRMLLLFVFLFTGENFLSAQINGVNREKYKIPTNRTDKPIKLDGIFDEET